MRVSSQTPNIRISARSKAVLQVLAKREGKPMQSVLDEAIEHYQREKFLDEANAAYATLRADPKAWNEEMKERQIWDKTLKDGIEEE